MRNRYSAATYSIIHHARMEAEALGYPNSLSTKHLLLAMLHDSRSKAMRTLEALGASADRIRAAVELLAEQEDELPLPVAPDAETRKAMDELGTAFNAEWEIGIGGLKERLHEFLGAIHALELRGKHPARQAIFASYGYTRALWDSKVAEPHHLLLALIREEKGLASRVFAYLNLTFIQVFNALKDAPVDGR